MEKISSVCIFVFFITYGFFFCRWLLGAKSVSACEGARTSQPFLLSVFSLPAVPRLKINAYICRQMENDAAL